MKLRTARQLVSLGAWVETGKDAKVDVNPVINAAKNLLRKSHKRDKKRKQLLRRKAKGRG